MIRMLIVLVILAGLAVGQKTARMTMPDDTVVLLDGSASSSVPHLASFRTAGGIVVAYNENTIHEGAPPLYFKRLEVQDAPAGQWNMVIGEDARKRGLPVWPRSLTENLILGGEWIPILGDGGATLPSHFPMPDTAWADVIWHEVSGGLDLDAFDHPRMVQALSNFGRKDFVPGEEQKDLYDVQSRWGTFFGGPNPTGWYETWNPKADGYSNGHYDYLLWQSLKWMTQGRRQADWDYLMQSAIAHVCYGMVHGRSNLFGGWDIYEKSGWDPIHHNRIVGGDWNPDSAKLWVRGLGFVESLSGHPVLTKALLERVEMLATVPASRMWDGSWGVRKAARYLDDLHVAYLRTRQPRLITKAIQAIGYYMSLLDPDRGIWVNQGSPHTTSPWMQMEACACIMRWINLGYATEHREAVLDVIVRVWTDGTDAWTGSIRRPRYRFDGPEAVTGHQSLVGYFLPAMRQLARYREAWDPTYLTLRAHHYDHIGTSWGQVLPPTVLYRYGAEGPGHEKSLTQSLGGVIK